MSHTSNSVPSVTNITALRGDKLTIDMGKTFTGTLTSWMRRESDSINYRSFTIIDNRYLTLSKEKTSDYIDSNGNTIETISGKWLFDVKSIEDIQKPEDIKAIFRGIIFFKKDIVGLPVERPVEVS